MNSPCKPIMLEILHDDLPWWSRFLKTDIRVIQKIIDGTGTIHLKTAQDIIKNMNEKTGDKDTIEKYFYTDRLIGYKQDREVKYQYAVNTLTDIEKADIIRYILEKRWHAFSLLEILLFIFVIGMIWSLISYFFL